MTLTTNSCSHLLLVVAVAVAVVVVVVVVLVVVLVVAVQQQQLQQQQPWKTAMRGAQARTSLPSQRTTWISPPTTLMERTTL
jgi:heme/copper-type cytochrome/quinol oxidase subunit 2